MTVLMAHLALALTAVADEMPEPEDVKAGWVGFAVFVLLIAAVAFLGFSLTKHLRRAQAAEEAGLYGNDDPDVPAAGEGGAGDGPATGSDAEPETRQSL